MKTTRYRAIVLSVAVAGVAVAVLGGCGGGGDDGGGGDSAAGPEPEESGENRNSSAGSAPASPEAADGTDLGQCSDADCEVVVHEGDEIPMGGTQGIERLVVDSADDERMALTGTGPGTTVSGSIGAPYPAGPVLNLNGMGVAVVSAGPDHAIIELSPPQ